MNQDERTKASELAIVIMVMYTESKRKIMARKLHGTVSKGWWCESEVGGHANRSTRIVMIPNTAQCVV